MLHVGMRGYYYYFYCYDNGSLPRSPGTDLIWTVVFARCLLEERPGTVELLAVAMSFTGALAFLITTFTG